MFVFTYIFFEWLECAIFYAENNYYVYYTINQKSCFVFCFLIILCKKIEIEIAIHKYTRHDIKCKSIFLVKISYIVTVENSFVPYSY